MTSETNFQNKTVLWWGRFDPNYSRNRVLREAMRRLGYTLLDFHPRVSKLGDLEASLKRLPVPDLVWVPCFRHRDLAAAARWAGRHGIPLVFDPLISSYQKRFYEQKKLKPGSRRAQRACDRERRLFARADHVVADTDPHRAFYRETLRIPDEKISVIHVGASDEFQAAPPRTKAAGEPLDVLFYGSFLPLHGIPTIINAARHAQHDNIRWTILGDGPEKEACRAAADGLTNLRFEPPVPYENLCARIHAADVILGVFGDTAQASRVMPNKVFQALAAGRPVVTRTSSAYPDTLGQTPAVTFVPPADPIALADAVRRLADDATCHTAARAARGLFDAEFSIDNIQAQLARTIATTMQHRFPAESPRVSIVIPVFNVAPYLARCLESILNQTYTHLEVLCIDDGSTDGSADILAAFAQKDPRVRIITHETNRGPGGARNSGLDRMTGAYLAFVDSDDMLPDYAIETFLRVARESGQAAVIAHTCTINHLPGIRKQAGKWHLEKPALAALMSGKKFPYSLWNKFFRADLFARRRFLDDITYEDWPLITELFGSLASFACIHEPLYVYCRNNASITRSNFTKAKANDLATGIEHVLAMSKGQPSETMAKKCAAGVATKLIKKVYKSLSADMATSFWACWTERGLDQHLRPLLPLKARYRLFQIRRRLTRTRSET